MRLRTFKPVLGVRRRLCRLKSLCPTQPTAIPNNQDQQPEADSIPRERREIVRGDVTQQPSNTHECADKRCHEPNHKQAHRIDGQRAPLFRELVKCGAENNGNVRKKENSVATLRSSPNNIPPIIVDPEREVPGISAKHWASPTLKASA